MSVKINVTGEDGDSREIEWEDHQTLLEAVQANGFPVLATCGGNASCATCHTFIDQNTTRLQAIVPTLRRTSSTW